MNTLVFLGISSDSSLAARSAAVEINNCSVAVRWGTLARSVVQAASPRLAATTNNSPIRGLCFGLGFVAVPGRGPAQLLLASLAPLGKPQHTFPGTALSGIFDSPFSPRLPPNWHIDVRT